MNHAITFLEEIDNFNLNEVLLSNPMNKDFSRYKEISGFIKRDGKMFVFFTDYSVLIFGEGTPGILEPKSAMALLVMGYPYKDSCEAETKILKKKKNDLPS